MMKLSRLVLALPLCLSATIVGGCNRSSDGTVVLPKQLDSRRFWQDDEAKRAAVERAQATSFPAEPQIRFVEEPPRPRSSPRPRRNTVVSTSETARPKPMACRAVTGTSGRVRYVCD